MSHALLGRCYLCVPQSRTVLMKETGKEYVGHAIRYMQPDSTPVAPLQGRVACGSITQPHVRLRKRTC